MAPGRADGHHEQRVRPRQPEPRARGSDTPAAVPSLEEPSGTGEVAADEQTLEERAVALDESGKQAAETPRPGWVVEPGLSVPPSAVAAAAPAEAETGDAEEADPERHSAEEDERPVSFVGSDREIEKIRQILKDLE